MTATIVDGRVDTDDDLVLDSEEQFAEPCEAEYSDGEKCDREADYVCMVSCCGARVLFCEECLFEFVEYCREHDGESYYCNFCDSGFRVHTNHLIVTGRV
jgi:hypothetical protein